jgi:hypothetical protein
LNQIIAEYELSGELPTLPKIAEKLKKLSFTTDVLGASKTKIDRTTIRSYEDIIRKVGEHFGIETDGIL